MTHNPFTFGPLHATVALVGVQSARGTTLAGNLLEAMLSRPGAYRTTWTRRARQVRPGTVNRAAVARVIAEYLWMTEEAEASSYVGARELKDRVGRALAGEVLSARTLDWFVQAFAMDEADASRLWSLLTDDTEGQIALYGGLATPGEIARRLPPRRHLTVALHDLCRVDDHGYLQSQRTIQVILGAAPGGVEAVQFRSGSEVEAFRVVRGGKTRGAEKIGTDLNIIDIELPEPLEAGRTASLEYEVKFDSRRRPEQEFRRIIFRRVENAEIAIQFSGAPPKFLWHAIWPSLESREPCLKEVAVGPDNAAHQYFEAIEGAIVGFKWEF